MILFFQVVNGEKKIVNNGESSGSTTFNGHMDSSSKQGSFSN